MTKQEWRQEQRVKPMGVEGIAQCREIVERGQYAKVNEVMVDLFSASAIVQVYDAINPANREKMVSFPVAAVADVVFKLLGDSRT